MRLDYAMPASTITRFTLPPPPAMHLCSAKGGGGGTAMSAPDTRNRAIAIRWVGDDGNGYG
ncbi:hypothetical protein GCM10007860_27650 [Chitiniphilus shinanonensis]|uniref:Uncharacterized protein n=1 Tax=Chitiniphilus shinanonensis TaxID=553088 RepID=A0ABQ6BV73_9NEIS|nr:hypothetical protein GCM10007860_27650 [Chitiniphilus shinanonensis]